MARSHAVWVVTNELYPWPAAAFTVKGELKLWLENQESELRLWMHVWRCENPAYSVGGRYHLNRETPKPTEVDIDELLGVS